MKKIAIIGSGFFGVSSALILSKKHKIDLYKVIHKKHTQTPDRPLLVAILVMTTQ